MAAPTSFSFRSFTIPERPLAFSFPENMILDSSFAFPFFLRSISAPLRVSVPFNPGKRFRIWCLFWFGVCGWFGGWWGGVGGGGCGGVVLGVCFEASLL